MAQGLTREQQLKLQQLERERLINQPRQAAPVQLPPQISLGQLASQQPIRGRGLPMMQGGLAPDRNALVRQLLLDRLRNRQ